MQFSDDVLLRVMLLVLGVCGFLVAKHIRNHKVNDAPLVCPIGFDCHAVVHSDYAAFMGMPVEFMGMVYYALISVAYFLFIFFAEVMPASLAGVLMIVSFGAFLFSVYLILVQIFILRKGCSWCIVSALISACIFVLNILAYDFSIVAQLFLK